MPTQPTQDIAVADNAPNMGTLGANASGLKTNPSTGQLTTADPGNFNASPPGAQTDINTILEPYLSELQNLGPEYQEEMDYLKPYLEPQQQTFQGVEAQSKAQESPTGNTAVNEADESVGQDIENEKAPGFGNLASAAEDYEGTVPYSQLLQTVLGAGKNEILYGTIPNISNISTKEWPESLQNAYSFLTQSATGTNAQSGLNSPQVAATSAPNPNNPSAGPNLTGGGSTG